MGMGLVGESAVGLELVKELVVELEWVVELESAVALGLVAGVEEWAVGLEWVAVVEVLAVALELAVVLALAVVWAMVLWCCLRGCYRNPSCCLGFPLGSNRDCLLGQVYFLALV